MTDINTPKTSHKALALHTDVPNPEAGPRGLVLRNLAEYFQQAEIIIAARVNPKGLDSPEAIVIALQMGAELGLPPMQSIQSIAVINGRPGVYGDCAMALVRASGQMENYTQDMQGDGDNRKAIVTTTREGVKYSQTFSVADAKRAGLWQTKDKVERRGQGGTTYTTDNDSPWFRYPDRMMTFRARGFLFRDVYADVLRGFRTAEELEDMPPERQADAKVVGSEAPESINTPKKERKSRGKSVAETVADGLRSEEEAAARLTGVRDATGGPDLPEAAPAPQQTGDDYTSAVTPPPAAPKDAPTAENDDALAQVLNLMSEAEVSDQDVADAAYNLAICDQRAFPAMMAITELLTVKKRFGEIVRKTLDIRAERARKSKLTPAR